MKCLKQTRSLNWLTDTLRAEISSVFTPKYKRRLSNSEIEEIAINLTSFMKPLAGGGLHG